MKKYKKRQKPSPTEKALNTISNYSPDTDPQGSYTGKPLDKSDVPVQDVDDL